jgi:hypothetical protein
MALGEARLMIRPRFWPIMGLLSQNFSGRNISLRQDSFCVESQGLATHPADHLGQYISGANLDEGTDPLCDHA